MICPCCTSSIDEDSLYCDQCGRELMVCSHCGKPGKGKHCTVDGKNLIPKRDFTGRVSPSPGSPPADPVDSRQSPPRKTPAENTHGKTVNARAGESKKLVLKNNETGSGLIIENSALIGRREGDFTDYFETKVTVSGKHATIEKIGGDWYVRDHNSTNGTFINSKEITPGMGERLASGDTLSFADVEMQVEIS